MSIVPIQVSQPHPRKVIRNKVKDLLKVNTDLGGRVFCSRPDPIWLNETPCCLIYFTDEPATTDTNPKLYTRSLSLVTEVLQREDTERENSVDDFLDSRAFEIEMVFGDDQHIGLYPIVENNFLRRTQPLDIDGQGEKDAASIRLYWDIIYKTDSFSLQSLDEFLRFQAEYEAGVIEDVKAEAEDDVTIREE